MEKLCPRCGETWSPDSMPDVEWVIVDSREQTILVVGPEHRCGVITEWS